MHVLHHDGEWIIAAKWRDAGKYFVQDNTERVEIGTPVNRVALRLLW